MTPIRAECEAIINDRRKWTEAGAIVRFQDDIFKSITPADLKR